MRELGELERSRGDIHHRDTENTEEDPEWVWGSEFRAIAGRTAGGRQSLGAVIVIRLNFVRAGSIEGAILAIRMTAAGDCNPWSLDIFL